MQISTYQQHKNKKVIAMIVKKILVAYFSCTGNTKGVAKLIASEMGADLYEITPKIPYTDEDLNYNNSNSRATKEQNDDNARPEIEGKKLDISQYDTIVVATPLWWSDAPRIICTFLDINLLIQRLHHLPSATWH